MNIAICEINQSDGNEVAAACAIERANLCTCWSEDAIKQTKGSDSIRYLVAKDEKIVGICSFALVFGEGQLLNIAVMDEYRRLGVGSMLLKAAIDIAKSKNAEQFSLEVEADNESAIAFYKKHHFDIAGRRKNFYGNGRDALVMIKIIN